MTKYIFNKILKQKSNGLKISTINILSIVLFITFSTSNVFSQSTCSTAVTMNMNTQQDYNITGTEYWIEFTTTTARVDIGIIEPQSTPIASITQITLYENTCNSLNEVETYNVINNEAIISRDDLTAQQTYYVKIQQSQAVSGYFGLVLAGPVSVNTPIYCPPPTCSLVPNGEFEEANINVDLMAHFNGASWALGAYIFPLTTPITSTSNVCGWGLGYSSPQLHREAITGGFNYYLYMRGNTVYEECAYSRINSGAPLVPGNYVLCFKYQASNFVNNIEIGLLTAPYTQYSTGAFNLTTHNVSTTSTWQQVNIPFVITSAQANFNYMYIHPNGNSTTFGSMKIDDIEIVPVEISAIPNPICQGEEVKVQEGDCPFELPYLLSYQWSSNPTNISLTNHPVYGNQSNNQVIYVTPNVTTTYTVTVTDNNIVSFFDNIVVTVYDAPTAAPEVSLPTNNTCSGTVTYTITNYYNNPSYNYSCTINGINYNINPISAAGEFNINWTAALLAPNNRAKVEITVSIPNPSGGCSKSTEFDVFGCCPGPYNETWTDISISNPIYDNYDNTTIGINGTVRIINNSTITITNSDLYFAGDGFNMWDGIYIEYDASIISLTANNNEIYDAKNAVVSQDGGIYIIDYNRFESCHKGIVVEAFNGDHQGICVSNIFKCPSQIALYPHSGEITQYGVEVNDVVKSTSGGHIDIGDESAPNFKNIFEEIHTGIYSINSDIRIVNNEFNNIISSGVYAVGNENTPATNLAREIIIGGSTSNHTNFLNNCANGINIEGKTHVQIYQNEIDDSHTAIQVLNNKRADINIVSNTIENTTYKGIVVTDICAKLYIYENEINWYHNADIWNGIWVINNENLQNPSHSPYTNICNNNISNPNIGIYASNTIKLMCASNIVQLPTSSQYGPIAHGISIPYNSRSQIHINNVSWANTPTANDINFVLGIWLESSPNSSVRENTISQTGRALKFSNDNSNGEISCNQMTGNFFGVNLASATIGLWDAGNNWYEIGDFNNPHDNTWTTTNWRVEGNVPIGVNHRWYYDSNGGTFLPNSSVSPSSAYSTLSTSGNNYCSTQPPSCGSPPPAPLTVVLPPTISEREQALGYAVNYLFPSTSSLSSSINTQSQLYSNTANYYLVKHTYDRIKEKPAYLSIANANNTKYQQFYNYISQTNIGKFWNVKNYILQGNRNAANNVLNSIKPKNLPEATSKTVYEMYLKYWAKENFVMSSQDSILLNFEAHKNPIYAGEDVYIARNMLGLYLLDLPTQSKSKIANPNKTVSSDINVYPNPTTGNLNIEIPNELQGIGRIIIRNVLGKTIYEKQINQGINSLNLEALNNSIYLYTIYDNKTIIETGKFIINK